MLTPDWGAGTCDTSKNLYMPWCCDESVPDSACHWAESPPKNGLVNCDNANTCGANEINLGSDALGDGVDCSYFEPPYAPTSPYQQGQWYTVSRSLCCSASALHIVSFLFFSCVRYTASIITPS